MPILGNNVVGGSSIPMVPATCWGHWDPALLAGWGNPVPACTVTMWWAFMMGPPLGFPDSTVGLAVYDASSGIPANYTVVITSPTFVLTNGSGAQWHFVPDSRALAAGTYGVAILGDGVVVLVGDLMFTNKAVGPGSANVPVPGTFPSPLGLVNNVNQDPSMYIDYTVAGGAAPYAPTAACHCQPNCGEG